MDIYSKNFMLCPGVEKCGTTSLFALLDGQPGLVSPKRKELFFFNRDFEKGPQHYQALFAQNSIRDDEWCIDITPSYFRHPEALDRIKQSITGQIAIIFLIRNPIKRAFSFYWHDMVRHILKGQRHVENFTVFQDCSFERYVKGKNTYYLTPYADMLENWLDRFENRCAVHLTEDVIKDSSSLIADINRLCDLSLPSDLGFPRENSAFQQSLSLSPNGVFRHTENGKVNVDLPSEHAINALAIQGTFTHHISKASYMEIYETFFADDIKRCEDILCRDLSLWREPADLISPMVKSLAQKIS